MAPRKGKKEKTEEVQVQLGPQVREGVDHISRARNEQDGANEVVYRSAVTMRGSRSRGKIFSVPASSP